MRTTLLTSYGEGARGQLLQDHLLGSGVTPLVHPAPTSVARAVLDEAGAATYDFDLRWELGQSAWPATELLHVGSIAAVMEPGASVVRRIVEEHAGLVSYDPNCRPALMGDGALAKVEALVAHADVVKLSDEDAAWLHPGRDLDDLALDWLSRGPRLVVVTRGAQGADAWTPTSRLHVDVPDGPPVVDTVGAGDSFMAGLLWAVLADDDDQQALEKAAAVARLTCGRVGADPPTLADLSA